MLLKHHTNRGLAQVAAEYDSSGIKTIYTYAGGVISQTSNNVRTFYVNDGHSGVRLITNNAGAVTDAYNYDGYGNLLQSVGNADEERYRGEASDSSTSLQYLRARYYDPSTGRFLSTDAFEGVLESPVSRHRYLYGNANPITYADPSGNFSIAEVSTVLSIIEILTITTASQAAIGEIARRIGGDIIWKGTYYTAELSSKGLTEILGVNISGGTALLDLTTETVEKSVAYPNITDRFNGKWLQLYGGVGTGLPDFTKGLFQDTLTFKVTPKVVARSPRLFTANPGAFTGGVAFGKISAGSVSYTEFTAGFGRGLIYSATTSGDSTDYSNTSISGKEGISIPVWFFPVNNQPSLPSGD